MLDLGIDDLCVSLPLEPTPGPEVACGHRQRDAEWVRFDLDVRQALRAQKRAAMAAIDAGELPARITVKSVQKASGRSRSQLYLSHNDILPLIRSAQFAVERVIARRAERVRIVSAQPSRAEMEAELRQLRTRIKSLEAVNASKLAAEIFALMFTRDGERAQAEIAQLRAEKNMRDDQLRNLTRLNADLSALKPLRPGARTIIDV
jgi:hypothetical protein